MAKKWEGRKREWTRRVRGGEEEARMKRTFTVLSRVHRVLGIEQCQVLDLTQSVNRLQSSRVKRRRSSDEDRAVLEGDGGLRCEKSVRIAGKKGRGEGKRTLRPPKGMTPMRLKGTEKMVVCESSLRIYAAVEGNWRVVR